MQRWSSKQLGLKPGSDDWLKFFEYAAVDAGRIPNQIFADKELAAHLPAFFRTLSGQKPSREDMEKLLGIIKGRRRPLPTRADSKRHTIPASGSGRKPTGYERRIRRAAG